MAVTASRKPRREPIDKLTDLRRHRWTPGMLCPHCGNPMYAYTTRATFRYLKCRACGSTCKEPR